MEAERAKELKRVAPRLFLGLVAVESFTLPIFRSGGRTELSFWGWLVNHTIFGPPVEYVPEEDYSRELEGVFAGYPVQGHVQTFRTMEEAMAYFKIGEESIKQLVKNGAISIVAGDSKMKRYDDLLGDVRHDHEYHPIRSLVQVDDPEVREVARVLVQATDFISAAQEFVNSFTTYGSEVGDFWRTPSETLEKSESLDDPGVDCDDSAILLCSILRNYIPPDEVYCAFGLWAMGGKTDGHMFVVTKGEGGEDRILESTAPPGKSTRGKYVIYGMFNDCYAFSTDIGLKEFDLKTVELAESLRR
ncbi:MAG: hypothetical protein E3J60_00590 [Dehalococcoidia bacterium]|nr:MAG: hypothetical protein E3J60_00590 [Dehalococcoidia bacterium]